MSDRGFDGPSPKKLPLYQNGVPRIEVDGVGGVDREEFGAAFTEVDVRIGDSSVRVRSDRAVIIHHDNPSYSHLDHVFAEGLVFDTGSQAYVPKVINIFAPNDEARGSKDSDAQDINEYDMLVSALEQEGFPVQSYSRGPSAETIARYHKKVRGSEEMVNAAIRRIIDEAAG